MKANLTLLGLLLTIILKAQTYFYIDQIAIVPPNPSTSDDVSIQLIGNLSSSGSYIVSAGAQVNGSIIALTVTAASTGGLTVLVPHTETISVGQLPAGDYTIAFSLNSFGILDGAPAPQHAFTVTEGDPCSNLELVSVQWHAFTDTAIVVHVQNNNMVNELFDYPNFILFDASGDTLAKETMNFFGIAEDSWHILELHPDATPPADPFIGTLELWTAFGAVMACTWQLPVDLCPTDECSALHVTMQNLGGAIPIGTYAWALMDEDFNQVAVGQLELAPFQQYDADTVCVPPGIYGLVCSPNQPPTGGNPVIAAAIHNSVTGPSMSVSWDIPPGILPLSFYAPCIDGTNQINDLNEPQFLARPTPQGLSLQRLDGRAIGQVELFDAQGRLVHASFGTTDRLLIPLSSSGMHLLRTDKATLKVVTGMQ